VALQAEIRVSWWPGVVSVVKVRRGVEVLEKRREWGEGVRWRRMAWVWEVERWIWGFVDRRAQRET